jgi:hypothetical protein
MLLIQIFFSKVETLYDLCLKGQPQWGHGANIQGY